MNSDELRNNNNNGSSDSSGDSRLSHTSINDIGFDLDMETSNFILDDNDLQSGIDFALNNNNNFKEISSELNTEKTKLSSIKEDEVDITSECKLRVSSYKYGYPPSEIIDNNLETYWQSEGQLPHTIILKYSRQIQLSKIRIYFDFPMDESYTPNLFTISLNNLINDYEELTTVNGELTPKWIEVDCRGFNDNKPIPTFNIKLKILNNMEDGRDSHIRQIRIFELKGKQTNEDEAASDNINEKNSFKLGGLCGLEKVRI